MKSDLSDEQAAVLTKELSDIIENDRWPFSPRIWMLKSILAIGLKLRQSEISDHESVWRRPRVLDLLKFTKNNLDPPVSSKTYSGTESDLKPRPAFADARLVATEKEWSMQQQSTQDRARPRIGRALARVAATLLLAAVVSQPELAHAAPYGGGMHAGGFGGFHGGGFHDGFVGPHHAVDPSLSLSAPTNSPLQEQMREDYATGLMGAQRDLLQQNPSGLGRQEQEIGQELNGYTPR